MKSSILPLFFWIISDPETEDDAFDAADDAFVGVSDDNADLADVKHMTRVPEDGDCPELLVFIRNFGFSLLVILLVALFSKSSSSSSVYPDPESGVKTNDGN